MAGLGLEAQGARLALRRAGGLPNTGIDLAHAIATNPALRVLVLNGYYDLATPFFGTEYTMEHLGLEKKLRGNIEMKYFEAGHMMAPPGCFSSSGFSCHPKVFKLEKSTEWS